MHLYPSMERRLNNVDDDLMVLDGMTGFGTLSLKNLLVIHMRKYYNSN